MTPLKPDRRGNAARIRAAARVLFLERGYGGTSMDAVASAAPVSKRTLYQYYPGKAELFSAVVAEVWGRFTSAPPLTEPADADPRTLLRSYVDRLITHWDQPDVIAFLRLLIAEAPRFPELAPAYHQAGKQHLNSGLAAYFAELQRAGHLRGAGDPALAAAQFLGAVKEPLFWPRVLGGTLAFPVETVVEAALDAVLAPSART
ncbi:TetR/AcrR family transcriptional regulator [Azorhizobium oxalatiphilum]|nr:TetR/AcrR family transcriptional regulator [Azorhizobium oxalatiphilum]